MNQYTQRRLRPSLPTLFSTFFVLLVLFSFTSLNGGVRRGLNNLLTEEEGTAKQHHDAQRAAAAAASANLQAAATSALQQEHAEEQKVILPADLKDQYRDGSVTPVVAVQKDTNNATYEATDEDDGDDEAIDKDDGATDEDGDEDITDADMPKPTNSNEQESIAVFYNVFTKSVDDIEKVNSIVKEQFDLLLPEHKVFVRSIGTELHIDNVELIRHDAEGDESDTLQLLWEHCNNFPDSKVVYLHSKGSFHGTEDNEKLRRFLTRGALSKECANLPSSCNACSSRMSPIPHPHTPGNMWLARCDYIKKLFEPKNFQSKMQRAPLKPATACAGRGRYAAEHWVHSHPDVMPCDVSGDEKYVWNYDDIPGADFPINLKLAPRFDLDAYKTNKMCAGWGESLEDRLAEYKYLYGEVPSESWWGWKLFNQTHLNE